MPSNYLILCHPVLFLLSIFPSIRVFSNESVLCIMWTKYWSFSFKISPSKQHPGLISFTMDWLDLLEVWGTLKSLPQHHSSKASIIQCSAFLIVQKSHPYMTIGKTIALTRWTFVDKIMSLVFNMISRLVMEKAMATYSSTLAWRIPWTEEPGRLQSMGLLTVRHDWVTSLSLFTFMHWRRKWHPLQCSCLENPRDGEPGGLPSMGLHRIGHNWSDLAAAANLLLTCPTKSGNS